MTGFILAEGERNPTEKYTIRTPLEIDWLSAIRLETPAVTSQPNNSDGRDGDDGNVSLRTFRAHLVDAEGNQHPVSFKQAFADVDSSVSEIDNVIDESTENYWTLSVGKPHHATFVTDEAVVDQDVELVIEINSGGSVGTTLQRFRLFVASSPVGELQQQALVLLRRVRRQKTDDYWANAYLAQVLSEQRPPRIDEALRYATVAASLRPTTPRAHAAIVRLLDATSREIDDPLTDVAVFHAKRLQETEPGNAMAYGLFRSLANAGISYSRRGEYDLAIEHLRKATTIVPKHAVPRY